MPDALRLGFTGDVMLGRLVDERYRTHDVEAVWDGMLPHLREFDGLFINLECCLSDRGDPWTETHRPFHFRADPGWAVPALEAAGVDWAALANNHVLDFGEVALADTLENLDAAAIDHAGAGRNRDAAWEPSMVSIGDLDVGLLSFTDNTPEYAAGSDSPGTAYARIDVEDAETRERVEDALDAARTADPDLLVASLHWGPNMVVEPPPAFRQFGRWLVEAGVDLIHGHSAHVFQGIEIHEGTPILYDTGDFVDDYAVDGDLRNDRSFLFEVIVSPGDARIKGLRLHPTEIDECAVHPASDAGARWSRERMRERSRPFETSFERADDGLALDLTV